MNCSNNLHGSNAIGNGEVDSSILSGSTTFSRATIIGQPDLPAQRVRSRFCGNQFAGINFARNQFK
jgi:hypothetical protein